MVRPLGVKAREIVATSTVKEGVKARRSGGEAVPAKPQSAAGNKISARLFRGEERKTTGDMVIDKFKELLKQGAIRPGDRIPSESELAVSFQASRGSIREAVKSLVGLGVLVVRRGDGTYVADSVTKPLADSLIFHLLSSKFDQKNLIEFREMLEYGIIAQAINHATNADIKEIAAAHSAMLELVETRRYTAESLYQAEMEFHFRVSQATHNPLMEKLYNFVFELFQPTIMRTHQKKDSTTSQGTIDATHSLTLEALVKRDHDIGRRAVNLSIALWSRLMD